MDLNYHPFVCITKAVRNNFDWNQIFLPFPLGRLPSATLINFSYYSPLRVDTEKASRLPTYFLFGHHHYFNQAKPHKNYKYSQEPS